MLRIIVVFLLLSSMSWAADPIKTFRLWTRHITYGCCVEHNLEALGSSKQIWSGYSLRRYAQPTFDQFIQNGGQINLYIPSTNFRWDAQWLESWPIHEVKDEWCARADTSKPFGKTNRIYVDGAKTRVIFDVSNFEFVTWASDWAVKLSQPYSGISFDNCG